MKLKLNEPWDTEENRKFLSSRSYKKKLKDIAFGMAGREVTVIFLEGGEELGYTNGTTIFINLFPAFLQGISLKDLMCAHIALIIHEHSHQLYSDWDCLRKATKNRILRNINNVLEDGRIERISAFKLPGWAASLYRLNKIVYDLQQADKAQSRKTPDDYDILADAVWNYAKVGITPTNLPSHLLGDWKKIRAEVLKARYSDVAPPCLDAAKEVVKILQKHIPSDGNKDAHIEAFRNFSAPCQGQDAQTGEQPPQFDSSDDDTVTVSKDGDGEKLTEEELKELMKNKNVQFENDEAESGSDGSQSASDNQQGNLADGTEDGSQSNSDGSQGASNGQQSNSADEAGDASQSGSDDSQSASDGQQGDLADETEDGSQSGSDDSQNASDNQQGNSADGKSDSQDSTGKGNGANEKSEEEKALEKMLEKLNEMLDNELRNVKDNYEEEREVEKRDKQIAIDIAPFHNNTEVTDTMETDYAERKRQNSGVISNMKTKLYKTIHFNMDEISRKQTKGKVDSKSLTNIINGAICCKRKDKSDETNLNVTLILDSSASMSGLRAEMTINAAIVLIEALELLKIPTSVVSFASNYSLLKEWRQSKLRKVGVLNYQAHGGTALDDVLCFVRKSLLPKQTSYDKLVFVLTDGEPNSLDNAIASAHAYATLNRTQLYGIGIACKNEGRESVAFRKIFGDKYYIPCPELEELPMQLTQVVKRNLLRD